MALSRIATALGGLLLSKGGRRFAGRHAGKLALATLAWELFQQRQSRAARPDTGPGQVPPGVTPAVERAARLNRLPDAASCRASADASIPERPMITVHHLNNSRSQRVLWLLEEMGRPYEVKRYERDARDHAGPARAAAIHPLGKSPVIDDGDDPRRRDGGHHRTSAGGPIRARR